MNMVERANTLLSLNPNPPDKAEDIPHVSEHVTMRAFAQLKGLLKEDAKRVVLLGRPETGKTLILRSIIRPPSGNNKRRMVYITAAQLSDLIAESDRRTKWIEYSLDSIAVLLVDGIEPELGSPYVWQALNRVITYSVDFDRRLWLAIEADNFSGLEPRLSKAAFSKLRHNFDLLQLP